MKIGRLTAASVSIASMLALTACSTVGGTTGDSSSSNTGSAAGDSSKTMVTVVKVKGIAWFDRMDVGVKEWGAENGYDTRTEGGTDVAPEKQIQIIQDLIAQKPVAITVVPNSHRASRSSPTRRPVSRTLTRISRHSTTPPTVSTS